MTLELRQNLYRAQLNLSVYAARNEGPLRSAFSEAVSDPNFLPSGGLLGFGLTHEYPVSSKHSDNLDELPLKGEDHALMNVIASIGLKGKVVAVYLADNIEVGSGDESESHMIHVMSSTFPLLKDYDESQGQYKEKVVEEEGGTLFRSTYWHPLSESIYGKVESAACDKYFRYDPNIKDTVNWIIPLSKTTQFESTYTAYGNEPSICHLYANMNIIVDVPPFEARMGKEI